MRTISTTALLQVLTALGKIPLPLRAAVGRLLGTLAWLVPTRDRRIAVLQLKWMLPEHSPRLVLLRLYGSLGQSVMEGLNFRPLLHCSERHFAVTNLHLLKRAAESKQPSVFLSAHTGNWDLLAAYVVKQGLPLYAIGVEARQSAFQSVLEHIRNSYGVTTLWRNQASTRELIRVLRDGKSVAGVIDQDTNVESIYSPFFGAPARSPSSLIKLAQRYDAQLYTAFIVRSGFLQYHIEFRELDNSASPQEILDEYHRRLENQIRLRPDQWVWFHKRWRSEPDKKRMSSSEYIEYLTVKCKLNENQVSIEA